MARVLNGVSKRKNPNPKRHVKLSEQLRLCKVEIAQLHATMHENKAAAIHTDLDFGTFDDAFKFPSTITISLVVDATYKCTYRAFLDTPFDNILDDVSKIYKLNEIALYAEIECKTRILFPKNMQCVRLTEMLSNNYISDVTIFICNATPFLLKL